MTLCTVDKLGRPSSRIVLLKDFDNDGFLFYTNYHSRKGRQISENPQVSLSFFWHLLERQVRIEGIARTLPAAQSDAYFNSRPRGSRPAAFVSPQRQVIRSSDRKRVVQGKSVSVRGAVGGRRIIKKKKTK